MIPDNQSVAALWDAFLASTLANPAELPTTYAAWHFCDNQADADALAQLVLDGTKTATCSAYWLYEIEAEALPRIGNYSVVTDWAGKAICAIHTTDVQMVPFNRVSAEFAAEEGEGDRTLKYWRKTHQAFFERDLRPHGLEFSETMPLVCEQFERVYP